MSKPPNDHPTAPPPDSTLPPLPTHTPEPWAVVSYQFPEQQYREALIVAPDPTGKLKTGLVVATVHWRGNQAESDANAELIRLSPRLARALRELLDELAKYELHDLIECPHSVPTYLVEKASAAHNLLAELEKAGAL